MVKRILLILISLNWLSTGSFAQDKTPRPEQYPVSVKFAGKTANVDIRSHPKARLYRTVLRESAARGVNFAGHYILAQWGCGASCLTVAIIDARNGKVFFPPELFTIGHGFGTVEFEEPLQFDVKSNLLIVTGYPFWGSQRHPESGEFYYVWKNNKLKMIYQVKRGKYRDN